MPAHHASASTLYFLLACTQACAGLLNKLALVSSVWVRKYGIAHTHTHTHSHTHAHTHTHTHAHTTCKYTYRLLGS